jgi:hypothetical protein
MKQKKNTPVTPGHELLLVGQLAAAISIASFFYYLRHAQLLLYGDAVAHINIARRVFDSRTAGPLQLGTVWLPLPHIVMMPFLVSRRMWQTGIGGSIPSMLAYIVSAVGIFRLTRTILPGEAKTSVAGFTASFATAVFALNPNLIYLQSTAMTEPIYLAWFIWAVAYFSDFVQATAAPKGDDRSRSSLVKCGFCLAGACLTRYDGWLLAVVICVFAGLVTWRTGLPKGWQAVRNLILIAVAAPVLWIAYNAAVYRNPLEFANGPYSAKAIEQKGLDTGSTPHPGTHDLPASFRYFFKSAELNLAEGKWQIFWVCALLLGTATVLFFQKKLWPLLVLWVPVPFYMLSIAYSGVPIFVPTWWPFSLYNVRYGIEMLPAFAVFTAVAAYGLLRFAQNNKPRLAIATLFLILAAASYAQVFRARPVSLEEAIVNSRIRIALEKQLASILGMLPDNSTLLMYLGSHVGALEQAGIPLSHVINEGNHRPWVRPSDPQGLWERALQHPASYADYVIAFHSDPVASEVEKRELTPLTIIQVTGQPEAVLYKTLKSNQPR